MARLPEYLRRGIINTDATKKVRVILNSKELNTVCESARCPNKNECYSCNTATFLIMGTKCTRNCRFCNIDSGIPDILDSNEPARIADAVSELGLNYVVVTSVTRDDLPDNGASHFSNTIKEIRKVSPDIKIEVLVPDFQGDEKSVDIVIDANPDVFNHNIETVPEFYKKARPQASYRRSLDILAYVKSKAPLMKTKTGLMVGIGETREQLINVFRNLVDIKCDIVTMGQYIQPSKKHMPADRFYFLEEYEDLKITAQNMGIRHAFFSPLARSSYKAMSVFSDN